MASTSSNPAPKKFCHRDTPEKMKFLPGKMSNSNLKCSKKLFGSKEVTDSLTPLVKVKELPHPFMERLLVAFLEKNRIKKKIALDAPFVVQRCFNYSREENSVIVEFVSVEVAMKMCGLSGVKFFRNTLNLTQLSGIDNSTVNHGMKENFNLGEENDPNVANTVQVSKGSELPCKEPGYVCNNTHNKDTVINTDLEKSVVAWLHQKHEGTYFNSGFPSTDNSSASSLIANEEKSPAEYSDCDIFVTIASAPNQLPSKCFQREVGAGNSSMSSSEHADTLSPILNEDNAKSPSTENAQESFNMWNGCEVAFCTENIDHYSLGMVNSISNSIPPNNFQYEVAAGSSNMSSSEHGDTTSPILIEGNAKCSSNKNSHESLNSLNANQEESTVQYSGSVGSNSNQTPSKNFQSEVDVVNTNSGCFVKVTNFPDNLDEDFFVEFIHAAMADNYLKNSSEEVALNCSQGGDGSVLVEFISPEFARRACALTGIEFLDHNLEISIVETSNSEVIIHNVPFVKKELLVKYLEAVFYNKGITTKGSKAIVECGSIKEAGQSVTIKLDSSKVADAVCNLCSAKLLSRCMTFERAKLPSPLQQDCYDKSDGSLMACEVLALNKSPSPETSQESEMGDILNVRDLADSQIANTSVEQKVTLKSEEGSKIFLNKLLMLKDLFAGKKDHSSGYARLLHEWHLVGEKTDITALQNRRKYFLDIYNKKKREQKIEYENYKPLAVLFGGASTDTLIGTEFEQAEGSGGLNLHNEEVVASTAAMFCGGAVFNIPASKALIAIVRTNHDIYCHAKNLDHFWIEVSSLLKEKGYYFEGPRCRSRFNEAVKLYRDEAMRRKRTGEAGSSVSGVNKDTWFWSDQMHQIMEKDVSVDAPVTISCGSSSQIEVKKNSLEDEVQVKEPRIGKGRVSQLRRPKSKSEVQNEGILAIADALNRRTEVLASLMSNCGGPK